MTRRLMLVLFIGTIFLLPLVTIPLTIDYYNPPKELVSQLAVILCLMLWLRNSINKGRLEIVKTRFYFFVLPLCLIAGLSILWAQNRYFAFSSFFKILTYAAAFFICVNSINSKRAGTVAVVAFVSGAIAALYAVCQYFGFDFIRYPDVNFADWRFKLYSTFGNPDFLANYLILIFPVGFSMYIATEDLGKKIGYFLGLVVIYTALLVTFSVSAFFGLFIGSVLTGCFFATDYIRLQGTICTPLVIRYIGRSAIVLFAALSALTVVFFADNPLHSPSILKQARASFAWRHGMDNRLILYRSTYRMIRDYPVLGVGFGNFKLRFPEYRGRLIGARPLYFDSQLLDREKDINTLNEFMQLWAELGIFGFISFILMLLAVFAAGVRVYYSLFNAEQKLFVLGLMGGILAFLMHSWLSFPFHVVPNAFLFCTFGGLIFTLYAKREKVSKILYITQPKKKFFQMIITILALLCAIWPLKNYLSEIFLKRTVVYDKKGAIDKAFVEAKSALFFNSHSPAIVYVGNAEILSGKYIDAILSYKKALENDDRIGYHIALAELYYKNKSVKSCIDEYNRALRLNPFDARTRLRLAELYSEAGMYREAEAECQFLLVNNPNNESIKAKINAIAKKLFDERFVSTYYGNVQAGK